MDCIGSIGAAVLSSPPVAQQLCLACRAALGLNCQGLGARCELVLDFLKHVLCPLQLSLPGQHRRNGGVRCCPNLFPGFSDSAVRTLDERYKQGCACFCGGLKL